MYLICRAVLVCRRQAAKGDPVDVSDWAPSAQRGRKTAVEKIESKFADLSADQKAELLAALQKQAGLSLAGF